VPGVRRPAAQGVRLDRRDLQRVGLLPHGFPRGREEVDGCLVLLLVFFFFVFVFFFFVFVGWRLLVIFDIIEERGEGLTGLDRDLTGGSRRQ